MRKLIAIALVTLSGVANAQPFTGYKTDGPAVTVNNSFDAERLIHPKPERVYEWTTDTERKIRDLEIRVIELEQKVKE